MSHAAVQPFPKAVLWAAAAIVGLTIAGVGSVRIGLVPGPETAPQARVRQHVAVVASRQFTFADRADGALIATDVKTGETALTVAPGAPSGFIRGVLRGLARERKLHEIGRGPPFTVTQWADGALTLTDPADGRIIELGSFGPTNRAVWARLLNAHGDTIVPAVPE